MPAQPKKTTWEGRGASNRSTERSKINIIGNEFTLDNRIRTVSGFATLRSYRYVYRQRGRKLEDLPCSESCPDWLKDGGGKGGGVSCTMMEALKGAWAAQWAAVNLSCRYIVTQSVFITQVTHGGPDQYSIVNMPSSLGLQSLPLHQRKQAAAPDPRQQLQ